MQITLGTHDFTLNIWIRVYHVRKRSLGARDYLALSDHRCQEPLHILRPEHRMGTSRPGFEDPYCVAQWEDITANSESLYCMGGRRGAGSERVLAVVS